MKKYTCKLCKKKFANGRVLGGHVRGHIARSSREAAAVMKMNPRDSLSCYDGLSGNRSSRFENIGKLEERVEVPCPIRSPQVNISPSPIPSFHPGEWDSGKVPPLVSCPAVSKSEQAQDEEIASILLLLSRDPKDKEESAAMALSKLHKKVKHTTTCAAEASCDIRYLSRDPVTGKRPRGNYDGGDSVKKSKLDHGGKSTSRGTSTHNQVPLKFTIKIGFGVRRIGVCPPGNNDEASKSKFRCQTCSKVFKSIKAMYGHRRVHSDSSSRACLIISSTK